MMHLMLLKNAFAQSIKRRRGIRDANRMRQVVNEIRKFFSLFSTLFNVINLNSLSRLHQQKKHKRQCRKVAKHGRTIFHHIYFPPAHSFNFPKAFFIFSLHTLSSKAFP